MDQDRDSDPALGHASADERSERKFSRKRNYRELNYNGRELLREETKTPLRTLRINSRR